jgi:adenine-specific DNA methylase
MMKKMGDRGSVMGIFWLFILVAFVFVGISFSKPYYRYYTLGSHTRDFLKSDIGNIEAIRKDVMDNAAELKVPLDEKDLEVVMVNKIIKVKATWSETVDFWGYYKKKIDFAMEEEY